MSQILEEIRQKNPHLPISDTVKGLAADLEKAEDYKRVIKSDGGKRLVKAVHQNIARVLVSLLGVYHTASRDEIVALLAKIEANAGLIDELVGGAEQIQILEQSIENELVSSLE